MRDPTDVYWGFAACIVCFTGLAFVITVSITVVFLDETVIVLILLFSLTGICTYLFVWQTKQWPSAANRNPLGE